MTKLIAMTTGQFMLLAPNGEEISKDKPHVITMSTFVEERLATGEIKVFARNLPKSANDAAFQEFLSAAESIDLAVAAYCSTLGVDIDGHPVEVKAGEQQPNQNTGTAPNPVGLSDLSKQGEDQ